MCSQVVKRVREGCIRLLDSVFVAIVAHLMGVHANHRHFDRSSEIEIVEAQMIGGLLDLDLCQGTCIVADTEEDRAGGGNCSVVRDQEEIEY